MADAEDRELLRLLTDDPEAGVRALMDRYGGILYRIAFRLLQSPEDAEEATADALAAAWREAGGLLEAEKPLLPWMIVAVRNRAVDRLRERGRKATLPLPEGECAPETRESDGEAVIASLVLELPEPDREIFLRRYYRMETAEEIGRAVKMTAHNVNVRLSRGRERLKKEYLKRMGKEKAYVREKSRG